MRGKEKINIPDQDGEGETELFFNFNINMKEMSSWSPHRITLFFGGIAKMIKATREMAA